MVPAKYKSIRFPRTCTYRAITNRRMYP